MWQTLRPKDALQQLGTRLRQQRISQGLTQQQLAEHAGVARRSVIRLEDTGIGKTDTLIRILTALNIADRLDTILPEETPSPLTLLAQDAEKKQRQRVRHKKKR
ncbi:MAG: helix-turn-helix domain-containing protein [Gammaproteobacteria bacterium]